MKNRKNKHRTTKNTKPNSYPFLSNTQHLDNEKAVHKFIEMNKKWSSNQHSPEVIDYISKLEYAVKIRGVEAVTDRETILECMSCVVNSTVDTDNSKEHGTAMFPLYNNVWNIGIFGSIWLDIELDCKRYRLSLYNQTPPIIYITESPSYFLHEA